MKRNWNLIHAILLDIEASEEFYYNLDLNKFAPDYDAETIAYHMKLLLEAGLIEALTTHSSFDSIVPVRYEMIQLTWRGHDFISKLPSPIF